MLPMKDIHNRPSIDAECITYNGKTHIIRCFGENYHVSSEISSYWLKIFLPFFVEILTRFQDFSIASAPCLEISQKKICPDFVQVAKEFREICIVSITAKSWLRVAGWQMMMTCLIRQLQTNTLLSYRRSKQIFLPQKYFFQIVVTDIIGLFSTFLDNTTVLNFWFQEISSTVLIKPSLSPIRITILVCHLFLSDEILLSIRMLALIHSATPLSPSKTVVLFYPPFFVKLDIVIENYCLFFLQLGSGVTKK